MAARTVWQSSLSPTYAYRLCRWPWKRRGYGRLPSVACDAGMRGDGPHAAPPRRDQGNLRRSPEEGRDAHRMTPAPVWTDLSHAEGIGAAVILLRRLVT